MAGGGIGTTHVITYDVRSDRRRARLCKFLEARATRVQLSVFEIIATADEVTKLLEELVDPKRFDAGEDGLRCYAVCAACRSQTRTLGRGMPVNEPGAPIVL
jgi:CRISPR-associated endonuclease Cas2